MRAALDEVGDELGRYIRLCNYASGLCMPEIATMGALERLDMMLNDSMYGIIFRNINMQRTFVDQYLSRLINARAGIIINTGEDNYLTTADAFEQGYTVVSFGLHQRGVRAARQPRALADRPRPRLRDQPGDARPGRLPDRRRAAGPPAASPTTRSSTCRPPSTCRATSSRATSSTACSTSPASSPARTSCCSACSPRRCTRRCCRTAT